MTIVPLTLKGLCFRDTLSPRLIYRNIKDNFAGFVLLDRRWYEFLSHQPDFASVKSKLPKVEPQSAVVEKGGPKKEKQKDEGRSRVFNN